MARSCNYIIGMQDAPPEEERIGGVIFLTADVHYAAVVPVPGNTALREVIRGPARKDNGNRQAI